MHSAIARPIRSCSALFSCRKAAGAVFAACLCIPSQAQSTPAYAPPSAAAKSADLAKEALVFEKLYNRIREESGGAGTRQTTARIRIQSDAGVKSMAVLTFTYTASNQKIDIAYVRVIKPDSSTVATPDYNIQDLPADVTRTAPMYSDIHQKHVAVRGLGVGDVLEYQVTLTTLEPEVPGQFWLEYTFEKNLIELDEQLDLDVPADKPVTVASADAQPTVTTSGSRKLYHWASSNLTRPDPEAPPKSAKKWKPSVQVTTFTSWEQVGAWYASLQKDRVAVTPAIQARANSLTKDLLAALLKAAGIEAWPVLISSGRQLDPEIPSPAQFDHVITVLPLSRKLVWMDSTMEVAPIGFLTAALRDKQALAVPVSESAYLVRTPADLPSHRTNRADVRGSISEQGVFTANIAETMDGDAGVFMRFAFRRSPTLKRSMTHFISRSTIRERNTSSGTIPKRHTGSDRPCHPRASNCRRGTKKRNLSTIPNSVLKVEPSTVPVSSCLQAGP